MFWDPSIRYLKCLHESEAVPTQTESVELDKCHHQLFICGALYTMDITGENRNEYRIPYKSIGM